MNRLGFVAVLAASLAPARAQAQYASRDSLHPVLVEVLAAGYGNNVEGPWTIQQVAATFARPRVGFVFLDLTQRPQGSGVFGGAGLYADLSRSLFVYAAGGAGSGAPYIASYRADLVVHYAAARGLLVFAGGTAIAYPGSQRADIVSAGTTYYGPLIATYRYFAVWSSPGAVRSHSQLVNLLYDRAQRRSLLVQYGWGNEAYLATWLTTPQPVEQSGYTWTAAGRLWLSGRGGVVARGEFQRRGSFARWGGGLGLFHTW